MEVSIQLRLSTSPKPSVRGRRKGSHVASTDDIHRDVENTVKSSHDHDKSDKSGRKPPGQFVSDELEEQTARFIEDVKGLAERRKAREAEDRSGPPPRGGNQPSSRL
jgi:hypothetical protein